MLTCQGAVHSKWLLCMAAGQPAWSLCRLQGEQCCLNWAHAFMIKFVLHTDIQAAVCLDKVVLLLSLMSAAHVMTACRAPGKLAPLPPVGGMGAGGGSRSGTGLTKRNSEGVRAELLRSGLLAPQPPAAAAPAEVRSAQQPLRAEASTDSYGADSEGNAAAAATAGAAGARMSDDSLASSNMTDSQDPGSWHSNPATAAAAMGTVQPQQGRNGTSLRADSLGQEYSQQQSGTGSGGDSDEDSDDDFGMRGQQQLLAAARRQLSDRSRSDARGAEHQGLGLQQQQQQGAGGMQVEVSGASLTLTCSADLDEDMIPEDISLPIDVSAPLAPGCAMHHAVQRMCDGAIDAFWHLAAGLTNSLQTL